MTQDTHQPLNTNLCRNALDESEDPSFRNNRPRRHTAQLTRRSLLAATGAIALTACSVSTTQSNSSPTGPPGEASAPAIKFPSGPPSLPSENLTFTWLDNGGLKQPYISSVLDAFGKQHTNIKVDHQIQKWAALNQSIPLAVRNNEPPDVALCPNNVPKATAVSQDWFTPLDDVIPNLADLKANFPDTAFLPGIDVFENKTYTFPLSRNPGLNCSLYYDQEYATQADVDPQANQLTWTELRNLCKKITKAGDGKYYGLMIGSNQLGSLATAFAGMAGAQITSGGSFNGFNWANGEYNYTADEIQAAFDLLLAIRDDGSIFPNYLSLTQATAAAQMPQRRAGVFFVGPYYILSWQKSAPRYQYGIADPPKPDHGKRGYFCLQLLGSDSFFIYKGSKYHKVAGKIFQYLMTPQGQAEGVVASQGILRSYVDQANALASKSASLNPHAEAQAKVSKAYMRQCPFPQVRNKDVSKVTLEMKAVKPNIKDLGVGIFSGQISSVRKALQKLNDESNKALDSAIAQAKKKGAHVSRDDYVFPNWDPTKDYTLSDYPK